LFFAEELQAWLLLDRIDERADLLIGGIFEIAAVGHDVAWRIPK
jgi:hypothetical protein